MDKNLIKTILFLLLISAIAYYLVYICRKDTDLFRYNTAITNFRGVFNSCPALLTIPDNLFKYNENATNFSYAIDYCRRLQMNPRIFCSAGDETTRFLNKNIDFTSCFERYNFAGNQGTAPDLWNYSYGSGTPTTTGCFAGNANSADSLTNYADIPAGWK